MAPRPENRRRLAVVAVAAILIGTVLPVSAQQAAKVVDQPSHDGYRHGPRPKSTKQPIKPRPKPTKPPHECAWNEYLRDTPICRQRP